jgi:hypothetical protein
MFKSSPKQIAEFCINHPLLCKSNKELVCKKTLQAAGYKTSKKFDTHYCSIYKELLNLVGHKSGNDYLKINETEVYCNMCSHTFINFLKDNNIKVNKNTFDLFSGNLRSNKSRGIHSKSTVKMTKK